MRAGLEEILNNFIKNGSKKSSSFTVNERRIGYEKSRILAGEDVGIEIVQEDLIDGVRVRFYSDQLLEDSSLVIYFHGGCFISGGFQTHDKQMRLLAKKSRSRICLVDYRLAPEYKFPVAHDDCLKVVKKLIDTGENKIILMGDSAGGNIALSLGFSLKNYKGKNIKKIILIYPMLDPNSRFPSMKENGSDYIMTVDAFTSGYEYYLNNENEKKCENQFIR